MKRLLIYLLLSSLALTSYAQKPKEQNKCEISKHKAAADLKRGEAKFLILGGIAPTYVKGQEAFEQKYKLKYFDFGCMAPTNVCIEDYNAMIAKHLDQTFGKQWRKEVRKDIKGI